MQLVTITEVDLTSDNNPAGFYVQIAFRYANSPDWIGVAPNAYVLPNGTLQSPVQILWDETIYPTIIVRVTYLNCPGTTPYTQEFTAAVTTTTTLAPCPEITAVDYSSDPTTTTTSTTTTTTLFGDTTTTTTTSSTTTTTTFYTGCEDCDLVLEDTIDDLLSELRAGELTSSCSIGEYVIDWYLTDTTGDPEFTSGSAGSTNEDVSIFHPFTGEPAQGGEWFPVIRYVYLNGIKYTSQPEPGARYSPDLATCIPSITVESLTCSNGTAVGDYSHILTYTNNVSSPAVASRTLRFDLDAPSQYLAWRFLGYEVPDAIRISYVSPTNDIDDELEYWSIGSQHVADNFAANPIELRKQAFAKITGLTDYDFAPGDYLRISVVPNGINSNTNWTLYLECLTEIDCLMWDEEVRNIAEPITMTWNAGNCSYDVTYSRPDPNTLNATNSIFLKYHQVEAVALNQANNIELSTVTLSLNRRTNASGVTHIGLSGCVNQNAGVHFTKSGNVLTWVFDNVDDYEAYRTDLNQAIAWISPTYVADGTNINHYKFISFRVIQALSCGDTQVNRYYYTHYAGGTPFNFNDATKTFTVTVVNTTNDYPTNECDLTRAAINNYTVQVGFTLSSPSVDIMTYVRAVKSSQDVYIINGVSNESVKEFYHDYYMTGVTVCDPLDYDWRLENNYYRYFGNQDRVVITDTVNPVDNFELWRKVKNQEGVVLPSISYILIYKVSGGSVVTNNITDYNTGVI